MIDEVAYSILEAPMNSTAAKNNSRSGTRIPLLALLLFLAVMASLVGLIAVPAYGGTDCLQCHEELAKKKIVHAAVMKGCPVCHSAIDATDVPHKKTNAITKGLAAEVPALCFQCHDKKKFEGKTIHPPVKDGMCLACHSPHSSDNAKLLQSAVPDLCFNCHDKTEFTKKNVHPPVMAGCFDCHSAHASKYTSLIVKAQTALCTTCHKAPEIKSGIHIMRGFAAPGHPVSGKTDPKREGKRFSCSSCHKPHSSDFRKLMRYKNDTPYEICINCHQK
jgi:predicted CXXCH cytochrome family protein